MYMKRPKYKLLVKKGNKTETKQKDTPRYERIPFNIIISHTIIDEFDVLVIGYM